MPFVVRQALAQRLAQLPELRQLLEDVRLLTGLPVRFTSPLLDLASEANIAEPSYLCAHLQRSAAGCNLCISFRQKLREAAQERHASGTCDAGLWEILVPVAVGTQVVGHLVAVGISGGRPGIRAVNRTRHLLSRHGLEVSADTLVRLESASPLLDGSSREALARVLQAVAVQVARGFTEHLVTPAGSAPAIVEQAYRIVHAEFNQPLRVPLVAGRLGVSAAHLSRTFHRATGLRLVDYISRYRAERARGMLQDSDSTIANIARRCGFNSVSQFNRVFRATFGHAPRQLRREDPA
ncbi:MAG: helix-turn-helix domain-containing protein [Opitutaceae bacterium]|nr:helix-turn-helix domain-containing protein [Opitutaceae bacterium]